jgi:uncharacterized protein (TIGR02145 family)
MKTIQIGSQVWTTKNLRVFKFRNGDPIPIVQDPNTWGVLREAAMCINPDSGECYYNWWAIDDPRGLAPEGFHVPTDMEWLQLVRFCGDFQKAGSHLKSTKKWDGTQNSGFNAIAGGFRCRTGRFYSGIIAYFWTSTPNGACSWNYYLADSDSGINRDDDHTTYGFSVRLIKD